MTQYNTGNPVPSSAMPDIWDNNATIDEFVNSPELTLTTRTGTERDTLAGIQKKSDDQRVQMAEDGAAVVEETRQNLIPLSRQYMTLAAAQADIANIPEGSTTYVRSSDGITLADEYINNSGILSATGRVMISKGYIDDLASRGLISTELDDGLDIVDVEYDPVSMRMSKFTMRDGRVFIPLLQLADRSVGSMQLEDNAVTSDKLSSDLNNVIPRNLDPDTGYSDVSYDPVTNKMSTYTMTDGRVFIPLLQINTGAVGMTQLATELQKLIPMELDPDSGYSRVNYDPVTMRMSDYITTDGGVFISRLILGDEVVGFKTLNTALQNKIIAHPQDVVDARPDATRSTLSEIAVRTNARDGSAWSPLPSHVCKAAFGINATGTAIEYRQASGLLFTGKARAGVFT
ncbi:TPA: hypothetical protein ACXE52_005301, partial [Klebsiella pneumoniae]